MRTVTKGSLALVATPSARLGILLLSLSLSEVSAESRRGGNSSAADGGQGAAKPSVRREDPKEGRGEQPGEPARCHGKRQRRRGEGRCVGLLF